MGPRTPSSSEAGFALIEVIVACAVLAIVALAVLSGIDGATAASTREKARAVAANLAEQDQERLRAMPVDLLKDPPPMNGTGDAVIDGTTYHVTSEAQFITDDLSGVASCGSATSQVEYLHIVTTVTSAVVGARIPAVRVDSLVSPTTTYAEGHGALGIKLNDRTGTKGVAGITVSAGNASYTADNGTTDAAGCYVFNSLPIGTYTITVNEPGYVGRDLNQKATVTGTVVRKAISWSTLQYDRAVTIRATFKTHTPGKTFPGATAATGLSASTSTYLSATNGANVGMLRTVKGSAPSAAIDSAGLYPYTENAYAFFAGECKYASPEVYNKDYFSTINTGAAVYGDPTKLQPQGATVFEPPVNVRVMYRSTGKDQDFLDKDITVYAKLQKPSTSTDSCDEDSYLLTSMPWPDASPPRTSSISSPAGKNTNHWLSSVSGSFDPGLPFGKYRFCVIDTVAKKWWASTTDYDNTLVNGGAALDLQPSGWTSYSTTPAGPTTCGFTS